VTDPPPELTVTGSMCLQEKRSGVKLSGRKQSSMVQAVIIGEVVSSVSAADVVRARRRVMQDGDSDDNATQVQPPAADQKLSVFQSTTLQDSTQPISTVAASSSTLGEFCQFLSKSSHFFPATGFQLYNFLPFSDPTTSYPPRTSGTFQTAFADNIWTANDFLACVFFV